MIQVSHFASLSARSRPPSMALIGLAENSHRPCHCGEHRRRPKRFLVTASGEEIYKGDVGLIPLRSAGGGRLQCIHGRRRLRLDTIEEDRGREARGEARPGTVTWCIMFVTRRGGGPMEHHRHSLHVHSFEQTILGSHGHEHGVKNLACCCDRLHAPSLPCLEVVLHQVQFVEYVYMTKHGAMNDAKPKTEGKGAHLVSFWCHRPVGRFLRQSWRQWVLTPSPCSSSSTLLERLNVTQESSRKSREECAAASMQGKP